MSELESWAFSFSQTVWRAFRKEFFYRGLVVCLLVLPTVSVLLIYSPSNCHKDSKIRIYLKTYQVAILCKSELSPLQSTQLDSFCLYVRIYCYREAATFFQVSVPTSLALLRVIFCSLLKVDVQGRQAVCRFVLLLYRFSCYTVNPNYRGHCLKIEVAFFFHALITSE